MRSFRVFLRNRARADAADTADTTIPNVGTRPVPPGASRQARVEVSARYGGSRGGVRGGVSRGRAVSAGRDRVLRHRGRRDRAARPLRVAPRRAELRRARRGGSLVAGRARHRLARGEPAPATQRAVPRLVRARGGGARGAGRPPPLRLLPRDVHIRPRRRRRPRGVPMDVARAPPAGFRRRSWRERRRAPREPGPRARGRPAQGREARGRRHASRRERGRLRSRVVARRRRDKRRAQTRRARTRARRRRTPRRGRPRARRTPRAGGHCGDARARRVDAMRPRRQREKTPRA